jgi:hypothetical protein
MARKATDLLDVFRHGGDEEPDDSGRVASGDRKRAAKRAQQKQKQKARDKAQASKGFEGLILSKGQLVLAGSACCLLLVLSFVLGLSTGRPGPQEIAAIRKDVPAKATLVMIRGELDQVHPATQRAISPSQLRSDLMGDFSVPAGNLRIRTEGGRLIVEIGPFKSPESARAWLQREGLDMAHLYGSDPFLRPKFVPYSR